MIRKQVILEYFLTSTTVRSSSVVHAFLQSKSENIALVTVKRELAELEAKGYLLRVGAGRSTAYKIHPQGRLFIPVDRAQYGSQDPDRRGGLRAFNFELFSVVISDPFEDAEKKILDTATRAYKQRLIGQSETIHQKELERFVIELSWKSSKIEGNTYTLLDTEKLLRNGIFAPGHSKDEANMILNHKEAFKFIYGHQGFFKNLTRANIEEVHKMIVRNLNVDIGIRSKPVGVTGSTYVPLDNQFQIMEAVEQLCAMVNRLTHGYAKALMTLLGISYIQPFEDGNKRTARLLANAVLLAHGLAPLSYRSVEESAYREAVLVFYELNSLMPFKKLFIEQYDFAAKNYLI